MKTIEVGIVNDMIDEPQEMFVGRLTPVSSVVDIGQAEADVVIVDEDGELDYILRLCINSFPISCMLK